VRGTRCCTADRAFNANQAGAFRPTNVAEVLKLLDSPKVPEANRRRLYGMLNCAHRILPDGESAFVRGLIGDLPIVDLGEPLPRMYVVGGIEILPDAKAVLHKLARDEFDPLTSALATERAAQELPASDDQARRVEHTVRGIRYGYNSLEATVESQQAGMLVTSETDYPGWTATVNDREVPIVCVNRAFRGIPVPRGTSRISMRYEPASLRIGGLISAASLVFWLMGVVLPGKTTRHGPRLGG